MSRNLPEGLLAAARNFLDITWEDPDGDVKLTGILLRGMDYLDRAAGASQSYDVEAQARALLFEYARYARSNALSDFQNNYLHELLTLQISQEVGAVGG